MSSPVAAKSWKCWLNSVISDVNTVTYSISPFSQKCWHLRKLEIISHRVAMADLLHKKLKLHNKLFYVCIHLSHKPFFLQAFYQYVEMASEINKKREVYQALSVVQLNKLRQLSHDQTTACLRGRSPYYTSISGSSKLPVIKCSWSDEKNIILPYTTHSDSDT